MLLNVERGIVKILFKYRYFQDLLIDIDIDIDISQILLINIDIFQNHHIDIDINIDIFGIAISISISISISIFLELPYWYRYFQKWPYQYWYRYRYFSKVLIYRQLICHIDISNRANRHTYSSYLWHLWDKKPGVRMSTVVCYLALTLFFVYIQLQLDRNLFLWLIHPQIGQSLGFFSQDLSLKFS